MTSTIFTRRSPKARRWWNGSVTGFLASVSGPLEGGVYNIGGGSRNDLWMQIRADVMGRPVYRPAAAESAFVAAIVASVPEAYDGKVEKAIAGMVRYGRVFEPSAAAWPMYSEVYEESRGQLQRRGYL